MYIFAYAVPIAQEIYPVIGCSMFDVRVKANNVAGHGFHLRIGWNIAVQRQNSLETFQKCELITFARRRRHRRRGRCRRRQ